MKSFNSTLKFTINCAVISTTILIAVFRAAAVTNTNEVPMQYRGPFFAWGVSTNGLRAGLVFEDEVRNGLAVQSVHILVLNSKTNDESGYVKPPSERFSRFVLEDSNNVVIAPLHGNELDGKLPQTIQSGDLPRTSRFGRNGPVLSGLLPLFQNMAIDLKDFVVQDSYRIKNEGEYRLTVWPAIYHFATNGQFVTRIELPPVSMKLRLTPSP